MDAYLDRSIKDLMDEFPGVQAVLDEYDIGCAACAVATCLLRDVVEIHALPADRETELMNRLLRQIDPGTDITWVPAKREDRGDQAIRYSPPLRALVDEHTLIKRWLAQVPAVLESLDLQRDGDVRLVREGLDFIRSYADRFHHAKEEDILFGYFNPDLDILTVMHADHDRARGYVAAAHAAVEARDTAAATEALDAYRGLLEEHITKEDEVLYPWMDRNLSTSAVGRLFSAFAEVDAGFGESAGRYERWVEGVERRFGS
jgi:hemerythrin-like domain-containing protein